MMLRAFSKSPMISLPFLRFFARKTPKSSLGPKTSLKSKLESAKAAEIEKPKASPSKGAIDVGENEMKKFKKKFPEVDLEKRSKQRLKFFTSADKFSTHYLDTVPLPKKVTTQIRRVFAKYTSVKVRALGVDYMKLYQALHAVEKPVDLSKLQEEMALKGKSIAFLPTQELLKETPTLLYQITKKRGNTEKLESSPKEKKNENEEKKEEAPKGDEYKPNKHQIQLEYDQNYTVAYLSRKFPSDYASSVKVFSELSNRLPDFIPTNFLSVGSMLGAHNLGFHTAFDPQSEFSYFLVEPNPFLRRLCRYLMEPYNTENTKVHFASSLVELPPRTPFHFSVVTLSRLLFEATSPMEAVRLLETAWERVAKGGLLVIFQPGSPRGFRMIHDTREWFRNEKKEGTWRFVAPCSHNGVCPLSKKADWWCNFEQKAERYQKEVLPGKKTKNFDYERFSYIVILKESQDEKSDPVPKKDVAAESFKWSRVIRPAIKRSGHAIMDLCTPEGEFKRLIVSRSDGQKAGWRRAKKIKWGDQWNYSLVKAEKPKRAWKVALNQRKKLKKKLKQEINHANEEKVAYNKENMSQDQNESKESPSL